MARARRSETWDHTASQIAAIVNSRQGLKPNQTVNPIDIHPLREVEKRVLRGAEATAALDSAFGF